MSIKKTAIKWLPAAIGIVGIVVGSTMLIVGFDKKQEADAAVAEARQWVDAVDVRINNAQTSLEEMKNLCRQWTAEDAGLTYPDWGNDHSTQ